MLDQKDKRVTLLLLVQVLKNHTDARHPLPITGTVSLQSRLCEDYDLPAAPSRNTLGRDLALLRDGLGYDIHRVPRKGFYLEQRTLTRPQKQLLKDMVERAGFLTTGNRETLLRNLDSLFGKANYRGVAQVSRPFSGINLRNPDFFHNLEVLNDGLDRGCQVQFTYNQIRPDGSLEPLPIAKRVRGGWQVHPFGLVYTNDQYYLIASVGAYRNLRHFRVDHMTGVTLLPQQPRRPLADIEGYEGETRLDLERYIREHLQMYGGEAMPVTFAGTEKLSRYLWDTFGDHVKVESRDPETGDIRFTVQLSEAAARQFARQYAGECTVVAPEKLRKKLADEFRKIAERYK